MAWNPLRLIPSFEIELHHNLWALGDAQNVKSKNYNTFKKYSKIFNFKILSHLTPFIYLFRELGKIQIIHKHI